MLERLRALYESTAPAAQRFRYALLAFDLVTILFVIVTSFFPRTAVVEVMDAFFGALILADFAARLLIERNRLRYFLRPASWADTVAVFSFLAPVAGPGFGFLRVLRTLRLLRTYQTVARLRVDFPYFRAHQDVILATVNLGVFLFITTGLIYTFQHDVNPEIANYADALYFTVTTLTTTGFGDITLVGTTGRMLSVGVMIVGVSLFLRLLQVLFRPQKVRFDCPDCGLVLHDADAIHCKHCGRMLRIRHEGEV